MNHRQDIYAGTVHMTFLKGASAGPYLMSANPKMTQLARGGISSWPWADPGKISIMGSAAFGIDGNDVDLIVARSGVDVAKAKKAGMSFELKTTPAGGQWARVKPDRGVVNISVLPDETFDRVRQSYQQAVDNKAKLFKKLRAEGKVSKEEIYRRCGVLVTVDYTAKFDRPL
jgi:hypothetical protein